MDKTSTAASRVRATGVFLASLVISGCSSYSGQKLGIDKTSKREIAPTGLPYSLTRPEFTLSRTPPAEGEKKATYALGVAYENDPSQRYDIRIDPSPFADATLTVKFTAAGGVASTTGGITDLVGPTITALGSFAKDVIAASATGVFDQDALRTIILDKMNTVGDCKKASVIPLAPVPYSGKKQSPVAMNVAEAMAIRIRSFKSDDEFIEKFHALTADEMQCLKAVASAANLIKDEELTTAQDGWKLAHDTYKTAQAADSDYLAKVVKAYGDEDLIALQGLGEANKKLFTGGTPEQKALAKARQVILGKSETALKVTTESALPKKMEGILTLSDSAWLGRHVLFLEREVARLELARIRQPDIASASSKEISDYVDSLQLNRARALGLLDLYERSQTLAKFLRQIEKKTDRGGTAPATAEFAVARQELDAVLTQIEARRTKVVAAAAAPAAPTIPAVKAEPIAAVERKVITDSGADGWAASAAGKAAKQFVLVLREVQ